ncbi:hypothetical protein RHGRI_030370 [Rhododendron griersonianum]|uniref:Uncharacterized protein n=1 Tax=Rhododendron griersonianum TaxID=479676 RepID=A0AAV6IMU3_9ERIC|nr:hypothetical protein RHGRI_030370 [Rhododendron griersonianum]
MDGLHPFCEPRCKVVPMSLFRNRVPMFLEHWAEIQGSTVLAQVIWKTTLTLTHENRAFEVPVYTVATSTYPRSKPLMKRN